MAPFAIVEGRVGVMCAYFGESIHGKGLRSKHAQIDDTQRQNSTNASEHHKAVKRGTRVSDDRDILR